MEQRMNVLFQREHCLHLSRAWLQTALFLFGAFCIALCPVQAEFSQGDGRPGEVGGVQNRSAQQGESSMEQEQRGSHPRTENANHALLTKAKSQGRVRVIVQLRIDGGKLETTLADPAAIIAQREAIARLQDKLL